MRRWKGKLLQNAERRAGYQLRYDTRADARLDIVDWIEGFYDRQRMRSSIGYETPAGAERCRMAA